MGATGTSSRTSSSKLDRRRLSRSAQSLMDKSMLKEELIARMDAQKKFQDGNISSYLNKSTIYYILSVCAMILSKVIQSYLIKSFNAPENPFQSVNSYAASIISYFIFFLGCWIMSIVQSGFIVGTSRCLLNKNTCTWFVLNVPYVVQELAQGIFRTANLPTFWSLIANLKLPITVLFSIVLYQKRYNASQVLLLSVIPILIISFYNFPSTFSQLAERKVKLYGMYKNRSEKLIALRKLATSRAGTVPYDFVSTLIMGFLTVCMTTYSSMVNERIAKKDLVSSNLYSSTANCSLIILIYLCITCTLSNQSLNTFTNGVLRSYNVKHWIYFFCLAFDLFFTTFLITYYDSLLKSLAYAIALPLIYIIVDCNISGKPLIGAKVLLCIAISVLSICYTLSCRFRSKQEQLELEYNELKQMQNSIYSPSSNN